MPWLVWLSGLSASLRAKGSLVWFPVRAHAWVAGQVPSWGHVKGNHTLMFLSLSSSLPSPLSKNTINKMLKKKNVNIMKVGSSKFCFSWKIKKNRFIDFSERGRWGRTLWGKLGRKALAGNSEPSLCGGCLTDKAILGPHRPWAVDGLRPWHVGESACSHGQNQFIVFHRILPILSQQRKSPFFPLHLHNTDNESTLVLTI